MFIWETWALGMGQESKAFGKATKIGQRSAWDKALPVISFLLGFLRLGCDLYFGMGCWYGDLKIFIYSISSDTQLGVSGLQAELLLLLLTIRDGEGASKLEALGAIVEIRGRILTSHIASFWFLFLVFFKHSF